MLRRFSMLAETTALADQRQVRVVVSTETLGRDALVVMTTGCDLTAYRRNPVVLWQHDPDRPIARAIDIRAEGGRLVALAQFPAEGASRTADEVYAMIQANVVNAASLGFEPLEMEPIDRANPSAGQRIVRCEVQEFSFVSIPALPDALVIERGARWSAGDPATARRAARRLLADPALTGYVAARLEDLTGIRAPERENEIGLRLGAALQTIGEALRGMARTEAREMLRDGREVFRDGMRDAQREVVALRKPSRDPSRQRAYAENRPAYTGDRTAWMAAMDAWMARGAR